MVHASMGENWVIMSCLFHDRQAQQKRCPQLYGFLLSLYFKYLASTIHLFPFCRSNIYESTAWLLEWSASDVYTLLLVPTTEQLHTPSVTKKKKDRYIARVCLFWDGGNTLECSLVFMQQWNLMQKKGYCTRGIYWSFSIGVPPLWSLWDQFSCKCLNKSSKSQFLKVHMVHL